MKTRNESEHLTDEVLAQLLDEHSTFHGTPAQTAHLDTCENCQSRIQLMAADPWWWTEGVESLVNGSEVTQGESYDSMLSGPQSVLDSVSDIGEVLQNSAHPEMLGRLDEYEIERLIGVGGMGIVFKAFDRELNRAIALKALLPRLASYGPARKRFSREARAAAAICHENVVAIHRIQSNAKTPYLVMPYVNGGSLQTLVEEQGPLDMLEVVRIAMQVARGLEAAHEQGLVHRDIKPANILLENGCNRVQITDFGLARAADDASLTRTGLIAGTPYYMSPEQARGGSIDVRSDLFSLGGVLYFLIAGRPPFRADHAMGVLNKICQEPAKEIRELNPDVPQALAFAVHRLLEKQPDRRFQSASEVASFMQSLLAFMQNPTRNKPPRIKPPKRIRVRRLKAAIASVSIAVLVVSGVIGLSQWRNPIPPTKVEESNRNLGSSMTADQGDFETQSDRADQAIRNVEANKSQVSELLAPSASWATEVSDIDAKIQSLLDENPVSFD